MTDAGVPLSTDGRKKRRVAYLALAVAVLPVLTISVGSAGLPLHDVIGVIASHVPGLDIDITWSRTTDAIVWLTRLPRIIAALAVGAILGVSGVVLQALVRNPLAEPYILGVSSGASAGAAIAMVILGVTSALWVGSLAFAGALIATFAVLLIAGRSHSATVLILSGLAVGFGFQALTNLVTFSAASPETARAVMFWILGSLARVGWDDLPRIVAAAALLTVVMAALGPILDALASGDRAAQAVGIEPGRTRVALLIPTSAAVALAVAATGGIGFVGLIIPHLMRRVVGHSHRYLVLACALASGIFLLLADTVARIIFAPSELPIGVLTGIIGAPFLVELVRRSRTQL